MQKPKTDHFDPFEENKLYPLKYNRQLCTFSLIDAHIDTLSPFPFDTSLPSLDHLYTAYNPTAE